MSDTGGAKRLGNLGEDLAAEAYKARGYTILERQYHVRGIGEADLICIGQGTLVIAEVKTRSGDKWGTPEEAVNGPKRMRLRRLAEYYIHQHGELAWADIRFDVVSVTMGNHSPYVNIIEEAF